MSIYILTWSYVVPLHTYNRLLRKGYIRRETLSETSRK